MTRLWRRRNLRHQGHHATLVVSLVLLSRKTVRTMRVSFQTHGLWLNGLMCRDITVG
jgi:hypothetical protein